MAPFNKENYREYFYKEFKDIEKFHRNFSGKFSDALVQIVLKHQQYKGDQTKLDTIIRAYSNHLINVIESVIEKDKNYSEYRLMIELHRVKKVINKITKPDADIDFGLEIENKVKAVAVNNYPAIMNFSANGFRLLDINLKIYTRDFLTDFYFDQKEPVNSNS